MFSNDLTPVKDVPVEELLPDLLVGEQVEQAVAGPHEDSQVEDALKTQTCRKTQSTKNSNL